MQYQWERQIVVIYTPQHPAPPLPPPLLDLPAPSSSRNAAFTCVASFGAIYKMLQKEKNKKKKKKRKNDSVYCVIIPQRARLV